MKIIKLEIKNIGALADVCIEFNKSLLLFFGDIKQGKTTILNAVRCVFGGAFPDDILRHGEEEGSIRLTLDNGYILRQFYRSANGSVTAKPLVYVVDGEQVKKPVAKLEEFLNPFLLNQDFLADMTPAARKEFFVKRLGCDVKDLDAEARQVEEEATQLRAQIRGFGDLDLSPHAEVDIPALRVKRQEILTRNEEARKKAAAENKNLEAQRSNLSAARESHAAWGRHIADLESQLVKAKAEHTKVEMWLATQPQELPVPVEPVLEDTALLDDQISLGLASKVRADIYKANLKKSEERSVLQQRLAVLEARGRNIKTEKVAKLAGINEKITIPGLRFDLDSNFVYEETDAGMLSTAQLMTLSGQVSDLYPAGFGLDLIDRAESLGSSVYDLVKRASAENKTILATIVGERPATVPENVGVFVVAGGKVS